MLPVFYINLAARTDRRAHMERQLDALGLAATRVDASTPASLPPDLVAATAGEMTGGELACNLSHRRLWRMMLDQGIPAALLLEDDVVLSDRLPALLADPDALRDADAIQIENHRTSALLGPASATAVPGLARHRLMSSSLGSAAYLMTSRLADYLLARPGNERVPLDSLLFGRSEGVLYERRIFQLVPALAIQLEDTAAGRSEARSDLTPDRRAPSRRSGLRLATNLAHALRIVRTFGPSGELFGARQLRLPVAEDLAALM